MLDNILGFFYLVAIIFLTIIFSNYFAWYYAIGISFIFVFVLPAILKVYFQNRKLKNLPDVSEMPDEILQSRKVKDWEEKFCLDMKKKFKDEKFTKRISKKQCTKLLQVYLETVRGVPRKEFDTSKLKVYFGDKEIK